MTSDLVTSDLVTPDLIVAATEQPLQPWAGDPDSTLIHSETEEELQGVDPNQVQTWSRPGPDPDPGSEPGLDPSSESEFSSVQNQELNQDLTQTTVYQLVYDSSHNVISIELEDWSQLMYSDSCVRVNEAPLTSAEDLSVEQLSPDLTLTEEEQRLLNQEGVCLPNHLPLTKAEERILKKVRRKIRNKQSAQDSRRRRKEYIGTLEDRAAACSAQNTELQRTVEQLERRNISLLSQLRALQSLVKQTASKGAQTSTCLLIMLVSLALIVLPSFSPFLRRTSPGDDYRPTGVISRNILTDPASSQPPANEDTALNQQSDLSQSGAEDTPALNQSELSPESLVLQLNQSEHSTAPVAGQNSQPQNKKRDL